LNQADFVLARCLLNDLRAGSVANLHKSRPPFDFTGTRPLLPTNFPPIPCSPTPSSTCHNRRLTLDLDERDGWPTELRVLLERYPRASWRDQRSPGASFWLSIHDGFRREAAELGRLTEDFRAGRMTLHDLSVQASPRLRNLIAHLHGHHEIEDFHYFPAFREADRRLAAGFDALARDHEKLQQDIGAAAAAADALMMSVHSAEPAAVAQSFAERYESASGALFERLLRHLTDEEDLIVPLLIDRQSVY
jgi:Hemerythrin HHE cation binding domain